MRTLFLFLASCLAAAAANVHVRPGATGANNGTDWNNAYTSLPAKLTRGDTYWMADGNYPNYTFTTVADGTNFIHIKKATDLNHGTSTGWQDSYGDGQAVFGPLIHNVWNGGGYIDFDGSSPAVTYGFKIDFTYEQFGFHFLHGGPHVKFRHVDFDGITEKGDVDYGDEGVHYTIAIVAVPWNGVNYEDTSHMLISHCAIHGAATLIWDHRGNDYPIVEYSKLYDCRSVGYDHGNIWFSVGDSGILRYNHIYNYNVEGMYLTYGQSNWEIYGNVFVGAVGTVARGIEFDFRGRNSNIKIYNNTFHNLPSGAVRGQIGSVNVNCEVFNNLTINCGISDENRPKTLIQRNNHVATPATFVDMAAGDYRLAAPTAPGISLGSTWNKDAYGVLRGGDGVWDVGAFEFDGAPTVPKIVSPSVAIARRGLHFSFQVDATGAPTLYEAAGLPAGLSINPSTGLISGTPEPGTSSATNQITLRAANSLGTATALFLVVTVGSTTGGSVPTLDPLPDMVLNEDAGLQTVALTGIGTGANQTFTLTAEVEPSWLILPPTISYAFPSRTGTLSFTPVADAYGVATLTVTVRDGGSPEKTVVRDFVVTINSVSETPTISEIPAQTTRQDQAVTGIPFVIGDSETSAAKLTLTASTSDPALLPVSNITFGGNGTNRTLSFRPAPGQSGVALISVEVRDEDDEAASYSFPVIVTSDVNRRPTLNALGGMTIWEDAGTIVVSLTGITSGNVTENQPLTVTATSSTPGLIPTPDIIYTSPNRSGSLTFKSAANASGVAIISVSVHDGQSENNRIFSNFLVQVNPLNDNPAITDIPAQTTQENNPLTDVPFTVEDVETGADQLLLTVSSSNPDLLPVSNVSFSGSGSNRTFSLIPVADQVGLATITIEVWDEDGGASSDSFDVSVTTISNQPPILLAIPDQKSGPDRTLTGLTIAMEDAETDADALGLTITASNLALVESLTVTGTGPVRVLAVTPVPGQTGTSTITVRVEDPDGGVAVQSFLYTVSSENSPPVVSPAANAVGKTGIPLLLRASANDDGLPEELTTSWRQISGPGTIIFSNISAPETMVTAFQPGIYFLRFTAKDGAISISVTNTVQIELFIP